MQNDIEDDDAELSANCAFTAKDFENLAKSYISLFFRNRKDCNGLLIEPENLYTERNISLVLNRGSICDTMPVLYDVLAPRFRKENAKRKSKVPADVECMLKLLNECSRLSIPKPFAAGLLVVYVETCEGYEVDI